jgi:hypothetical protein
MNRAIMALMIALVGFVGLAAKPLIAYEPKADVSWSDPDTDPADVAAQQSAYNTAAEKADEAYKDWIASGHKFGTAEFSDLKAAQLECIQLATLSYVKAMYAAEVGRLAQVSGDKINAVRYYAAAKLYAQAAQKLGENSKWTGKGGDNVPETSHTQGAKYEKIAQRHLDQLK